MRNLHAFPLLLGAGLFLTRLPAGAEVTKQLKVELTGAEARSVSVENLVGDMTVGPGEPGRIVVTATVHAESRDLADSVRLESRPGAGAARAVHVRYPLERTTRLRYPRLNDDEDVPDFLRFLSSSWTRQEYDGRSVRIGNHGGRVLFVDVEVRIPPEGSDATFRNLVGRIDAERISGKLAFRTTRADIGLEALKGEIRLEGTSGDIRANDVEGSWDSRFTSGDCDLEDFRGTSFHFEATSGDLVARRLHADAFSTRTTSGDVTLSGSEAKNLECHATSGDLHLSLSQPEVASAEIRTTSGDVTLRLPSSTRFEGVAEHGSGDVRVDFPDLTSLEHGGHREEFRHGNGGGRIDVRTGSGDFSLESR